MTIALGADHAGVALKDAVKPLLDARGLRYTDFGTNADASVDYPDFAVAVAGRVAAGDGRGLLVCGTGIGMAMAANKVAGIRAAVVADTFSAQMAAEHNDAQILCLGERVVGSGLAGACLDAWLGSSFAGGRHERRIAKLEPA